MEILRLVSVEEEFSRTIWIIETIFKGYRISNGFIYFRIIEETKKDMQKNPDAYSEIDRKAIFRMNMDDYERFYSLQAMASEDREYFIKKVRETEKHKTYDGKETTYRQSWSELFSTILGGVWACNRILTMRRDGTL